MLHFVFLLFGICSVQGYFTLPGNCPENVTLQEDFRLALFYGKWYQVYHYSSNGLNKNNCSTVELITKPDGIYINQSRVDLGIFHRFSIGKIKIPTDIENAADLGVTFTFDDAPRRLKTRHYPFRVLATNNNFYATIYTCSYSPLVNKHFIYVWILSRNPVLNDVSKELAIKPLNEIGIDSSKLVKDEWTHCNPKYYDSTPVEPFTFRYPVPIYNID
ncbi:insecticyanin-A-like [Hyposmocoma kahamanoa]|uniref:insecticyanin-A-like n=1 Tax=Hyposmocoma kahamanoa TaxID=1477025 RepID=UPI000E6D6BCC|nr:insecticyanin-A-like [Hyposmocoma kahamanoa]